MFGFQFDAVARSVHDGVALVRWDTGLGKSVYACALSAYLFEHHDWDLVIIVAPSNANKQAEWVADFGRFTDLNLVRYHKMPPKKRAEVREHLPEVLLSTYETIKTDACTKLTMIEGRTKPKYIPGPLLEIIKDKKVLVVYDELTKLGASRSSDNYEAHSLMLREIAKHGDLKIAGLTATPVSRDPESYFNVGRLLVPDRVGRVADFEADHVVNKNFFGQITEFKNIEIAAESGVVSLRDKIAPIVHVKAKTDDDVKDFFPDQTEESIKVDLGDIHQDLYETLAEAYSADPVNERAMVGLLRICAGHPLSLLHSKHPVAKVVVEEVGETGLAQMGSAKTDELLGYLDKVVRGQGAKMVIFTYFANTVMPVLESVITKAGYNLACYSPRMGDKAAAADKAAFEAGEKLIYLSSDAGSMGVNLPMATYVTHYELPSLFSTYEQRLGRASRMNIMVKQPPLTSMALVAKSTVEEGIAGLMAKRNDWTDKCIETGTMDHIPAAVRKKLLGIRRSRKPSRLKR